MKHFLRLILSTLLLFTLTACAPKEPAPSSTPSQSNAPSTSASKAFTKEELAKCDGKNGQPAYVAVSGKVYDVTNAKGWKNGQHKQVSAGKDLTNEINKLSPHGTKVLDKLPIVGSYTP